MENFSYYNIFETKGLEYIIIIAFLALLIPFTIILDKKVRKRRRIAGTLTSGMLSIPRGILHAKNHTWTHLTKSGTAMVGLDDLLLHLTGDVQVSCTMRPGDQISKGDVIGELKNGDHTLTIYSPVSGKVTGVNQSLSREAGRINEDPYHSGWICKIRPSNWKYEIRTYFLGEAAVEWSSFEIQRFRDFLSLTLPKYSPGAPVAALQDGGELRANLLPEMPGELWKDFQKEFLDPGDSAL